MVTSQDLYEYLGGNSTDVPTAVEDALAAAQSLVDLALANAFRPVPEALYVLIVKDVARAIYRRNSNADGIGEQYEQPVTPNDPLQQVRPILRQFVMNV